MVGSFVRAAAKFARVISTKSWPTISSSSSSCFPQPADDSEDLFLFSCSLAAWGVRRPRQQSRAEPGRAPGQASYSAPHIGPVCASQFCRRRRRYAHLSSSFAWGAKRENSAAAAAASAKKRRGARVRAMTSGASLVPPSPLRSSSSPRWLGRQRKEVNNSGRREILFVVVVGVGVAGVGCSGKRRLGQSA